MKKHLPNLFTFLNLFCGCIAVVAAVNNALEVAALFVCLGIFFDFFDGFLARKLKVESSLGLQLDSLADMVTSGLVPGIVMFQLFCMLDGISWGFFGENTDTMRWIGGKLSWSGLLPLLGFLITLASAYRLAKFNIDENQTSSFIGLPTPANALLILSLPLILFYHGNDYINAVILNKWFLIGITLLSSYLLNARLPLFALKFKNWSFKDNALRYIFLIVSAVLLITIKFLAIPAIIFFYIASSLLTNFSEKKHGGVA